MQVYNYYDDIKEAIDNKTFCIDSGLLVKVDYCTKISIKNNKCYKDLWYYYFIKKMKF